MSAILVMDSVSCKTSLAQENLVKPEKSFLSSSTVRADTGWFCTPETQPEFAGGTKALKKYLTDNINYPEPARQAGISGRVFISFLVDTAGFILDVNVIKGLGYGCDEEALRLVQAMPAPWKPATLSGRVIAVRYNLPVWFSQKRPE